MSVSIGAGSVFAETPLSQAVNSVMGSPYKYAGTTEKGFDCSGYTSYIFSKYFDTKLPHTSKGQALEGTWVDKKDLRPGDLVFFDTNGKKIGTDISHVGIYVGNGEFYHSATNKGITVTKLSESYYANRYVTARRVLSDEQYDQLMTDSNP
ncbi:NlpC/P60 family protein [Paenibacillus thalictri]|uniref:NlpC/P60 family protein n=2 Tax=Paenibacillus thalictri TaxID=2527873 RepID=A0A4V2J3J4_9BACL|nr:C40 family peptidase [Paenibacillus thalictri]TBL72741.1 NlpC/P60 family protein [Paenibacillus thalictri]